MKNKHISQMKNQSQKNLSFLFLLWTLFLNQAWAVEEFELSILNMQPGHSENSSDFETQSTKHDIQHRILNPISHPKGNPDKAIAPFQSFNTRSAFSTEYFNYGEGLTGNSHTLKAFAETQAAYNLILGGQLFVNALTSEVFQEGIMLNNNLGIYARQYFKNVFVQLGYNSLFYDKVTETMVGSSFGHNVSFSLASQSRLFSKFLVNYGAQAEYFNMGDAQNSKYSVAAQTKYTINPLFRLGVNTIFTHMYWFQYKSEFSESDVDDLVNNKQLVLGLVADYALSKSFVFNLSLDQTLNIENHSNFVFGLGTEFGF